MDKYKKAFIICLFPFIILFLYIILYQQSSNYYMDIKELNKLLNDNLEVFENTANKLTNISSIGYKGKNIQKKFYTSRDDLRVDKTMTGLSVTSYKSNPITNLELSYIENSKAHYILNNLHFEEIMVKSDAIYFCQHSGLEYASGIVYSKNGLMPEFEYLFDVEYLQGNWYYYKYN